jgi:hypothetical protein
LQPLVKPVAKAILASFTSRARRPSPEGYGQKAAPVDPEPKPIRWIDRPDVVAVVEDLADERWRPGRIAGALGLTRSEVITILRRTGR